MTQTSPVSAAPFDTGPLSWVIGEIRDALERSAKALYDAAGRSPEAQPTLLLHAKSHLHQAHGALQMVDVAGVERLSDAAERALDRFKDGSLSLTADRAATVDDAYRALVEYLDELLDGASVQPVRLFPYYRALQELLGAERVHPGDMLTLDPVPARLPAGGAGTSPDLAASRAAFEKALLPFLKNADPDVQRSQAGIMRDALAPIAAAQAQPYPHAFWLALQTVADLVAAGQVANDLYVKQLFGQINLQLRRLTQGHTSLPEALLRDALFFIAAAAEPTPDAMALRDAYQIAGQVPADYLARRYGLIDQAALKDAKDALRETKQSWDHATADGAGTGAGIGAPANGFDAALAKLAGASDKLGAPALANLLRELGVAANASVAGGRSDQFSLEMAEAMLFVEHGLDQVRQLPDDFGQHAEAVGQRLLALAQGTQPPDAPVWQGDLARELQQGESVAVLAGEIRTGLRQVEKLVEEYDENPARTASLAQVDPLLHQLQGAFSILDQDAATAAVAHVRARVQAMIAQPPDAAARAATLDNLARNIGALGFFTDALAQNVAAAGKRFRFDAADGLFQAVPFEAAPVVDAADTAAVADVAAAADASAHVDGAADAAAAAAATADGAAAADGADDAVAAVAPGAAAQTLGALPAPAEAPAPVNESGPAIASTPATPSTVLPPAALPQADAIEAELLEIFLGEAREVLDVVGTHLPLAAAQPADQDTLTRLRRSFHTLKGSSRMVGLDEFALGAAAVEKTMNVWLGEARAATPDLLALLTYAHAELGAWVDELAGGAGSQRTGAALAQAALHVMEGGAFVAPGIDAAADAGIAAVDSDADVDADADAATVDAAAPDATPDSTPDPTPDSTADLPPNLQTNAQPDLPSALEPVLDPVLEPVLQAAPEAPAAPAPVAMVDAPPALEAETIAAFDATGADALAPQQDAGPEVWSEDAAPAAQIEAPALDAPDLYGALDADAVSAPGLHAAPGETAPAAADLHQDANATFPASADAGAESDADVADADADADTKRVGHLDIALPLYNIYLAETDELVRLLADDFADWRRHPMRALAPEALNAAHTLGGTSATVGFQALRDLAVALEAALQVATPPLTDIQFDLLDETVERIRVMLQVFGLDELAPAQPELLARLQALCDALSRKRADAVIEDAVLDNAADGAEPDLAQRLDALFAATYASIVAEPPLPSGALAQAGSAAAAPRAPLPAVADPAVDAVDDLFDSYFDDPFDAPSLEQARPAPAPVPAADADAFDIDALWDTAASAAPPDDAQAAPESATEPEPESESESEPEPEPKSEPEPELAPLAPVPAVEPAFESAFEPASDPAPEPAFEMELAPELDLAPVPEPALEPEPAAETAISIESELVVEPEPEAEPDLATEPVFVDELDPDLLPVFIEEGADLLPQIGDGLRQWQRNPHDATLAQSLLRALHTVKGSARMAGAMRLGQHTHALETQIENMLHAGTTGAAAFDELLANYDQAQLLFEQLLQPAAPAPASTPASAPPESTAPTEAADSAEAPSAADAPQATRAPLVRVRADILDRLVNQAGEVSITRSKLETQVGTLRGMLADFSDNLGRLRGQLREVEMQAESQIASRLSVAGEREFDPLEFDRFTRLQELTRMMAESVNDVGAFQDSLGRTVDAAADDLAAQSRLTRELQRDLMRVRMVPFASLSERLFRVARQTAKETDKRVNLDIRGGAVEIDRSVLERMAAPFEHLLRNAIVHGVEGRAARVAAGKAETGEILVQVSQQGNEVAIRFSDDGAGLNLDRIRAKAAASGLIAEGETVSDQDAAELVFEPGFSTADTLTELAGRGVGTDVVRSEARALGGRVDIDSTAGQGAAFTIHLPLTLAVNQVVLVRSGARTHALPAVLIELVLQVRDADLQAARAAGAIAVHGEMVPLHYLPEVLREPGAAAVQRSFPVLVLKSGGIRVALQVDEVLGTREVVVKQIGPQLARMPGIVGATVLGSGEIVLILDPVQLTGRVSASGARRTGSGAPLVQATLAGARAATVMVVDDSLTVRKVSQRLLEREGYQVLLAKDGLDALEQMQAVRPDLMLVDIEMPRMDGFDLTRHVRGNEATHTLPIIMITSRTADKHRNYALGLGVDAYFGKPFQEDVLLAAVAGLLGRDVPAS